MTNDNTEALQVGAAENKLAHQMTMAEQLARSSFLPKHYQGQFADCLVALQWADRSGRDPLELLQNTFPVNGTPGMFTRYMIALERRAKIFDRPVQWEFEGEGDSLVVTCYGFIDGERYEADVAMEFAKSEGWTKSEKYKTPAGAKHMLKWRAAAFLIRFTAPDVLLGMSTVDELEDMHYAEVPQIPEQRETLDNLMRGTTEVLPSEEPTQESEETVTEPDNAPKEWPTPEEGELDF